MLGGSLTRRRALALPTAAPRFRLRAWLQPSHSIAAFCFALAAALQQKGALNLPTISLADPKSLVRLAGRRPGCVGTLVLFTGYLFQAGALDRGRLSMIQPLLVTTVVFALPLGYFLTKQHVGQREVIGAIVILFGLGAVRLLRRPGGRERERTEQRVGDRDRPPRRRLCACCSSSAAAATSR